MTKATAEASAAQANNDAANTKPAGFQFKVKKHVTVPLLKMVNNTPIYVKFESAVFLGKVVDDKKAAPHMANCINLETGEQVQIILGTVLLGNLEEAYPDESYVGKAFELVKQAPEGSRKYALYQIAEIEV